MTENFLYLSVFVVKKKRPEIDNDIFGAFELLSIKHVNKMLEHIALFLVCLPLKKIVGCT